MMKKLSKSAKISIEVNENLSEDIIIDLNEVLQLPIIVNPLLETKSETSHKLLTFEQFVAGAKQKTHK
ncbi:MAG: hypothetical protein NC036_01960 [Muribaculaceae bacterium]|nr:hypothetical protein [Muribaculaceae bacterium]